MRQHSLLAGASMASATSLSSICSVDHITNSLPVDNSALQGLVFGDVTAQSVYNSSVEAGNNYPAANGRNFCNVTVAYQHAGKDDAVRLRSLKCVELNLSDMKNSTDQRLVLLPRTCPIPRSFPSHRWRRLRYQLWCIWPRRWTRVRRCFWMHRRWHGLEWSA